MSVFDREDIEHFEQDQLPPLDRIFSVRPVDCPASLGINAAAAALLEALENIDLPPRAIKAVDALDSALAAAASGGDAKQAPGEAPQSGPNDSEGNAQ